jgi:hypothetical protein
MPAMKVVSHRSGVAAGRRDTAALA